MAGMVRVPNCMHTFRLEEPPSAEIGRRRTSEAHGCHARLPPCAAPETENCSCKPLAAAGILRRPTVLKELLLLPSLLPLRLMTTLLLLLHCRCRCRRCCRGFHCRCCCTAVAAASAGCRRSERQPLLQLSLTRAAAASRRVRRQRAAVALATPAAPGAAAAAAGHVFDFCQQREK